MALLIEVMLQTALQYRGTTRRAGAAQSLMMLFSFLQMIQRRCRGHGDVAGFSLTPCWLKCLESQTVLHRGTTRRAGAAQILGDAVLLENVMKEMPWRVVTSLAVLCSHPGCSAGVPPCI